VYWTLFQLEFAAVAVLTCFISCECCLQVDVYCSVAQFLPLLIRHIECDPFVRDPQIIVHNKGQKQNTTLHGEPRLVAIMEDRMYVALTSLYFSCEALIFMLTAYSQHSDYFVRQHMFQCGLILHYRLSVKHQTQALH
jgi:hypothetical protein